MKYLLSTLTLVLLMALWACKKLPGEGGTASIRGKIWVEDWNVAFTIKNGEYVGTDQDVYIIYGDNISYGDKIKTNYNGEFEFKYLRKGKYRVYLYSKDKSLQSQSGDTTFVKEVELTSRKQILTLDPITIYK